MAYKALYRKWRPEVFEEVIGQSQVIRTLKNQVKNENVSHAYLFSGIRGTGKTSTAKIFARAINCLNPHEGDPCNVCQVCRSILSEQMMDVLEIDAASNNGVDHIREIRESVKYPPVKGQYKVYIIDEVHMLSTGAFNALLKTLEEPPDHVVFILATTELHKIPATVLSRCLRFTFKPLGLEEIRQRLLTICRSLGVDYDESAITTIALNGEGALRDSLSILDQCLAYHPGELRYHQVTEVLGSINESLLFQLAEDIGKQKPLEVIRQVQSLYLEGKDLKQLVVDLMKHFRWLLMASMGAEVEGWETLPEETREQYKSQSRLFKTSELSELISQLGETEFVMKRSAQPQLMMENHLINMCRRSTMATAAGQPSTGLTIDKDTLDSLALLDERIGKIEGFLTRLSQRKNKAVAEKSKKEETEDNTEEVEAKTSVKTHEQAQTPKNVQVQESAAVTDNTQVKESPPVLANTEAQENAPAQTNIQTFDQDPADKLSGEDSTDATAEEEMSEAPREGCGIGTATPLTLEVLKQLWPNVLDQMRQDKKVSIQAMAKEAQLTDLEGCELTLSFTPEKAILRERLNRQDIKEYLAILIQKKTGRRLKLNLILAEEEDKSGARKKSVSEKLKQVVPEELIVEEE